MPRSEITDAKRDGEGAGQRDRNRGNRYGRSEAARLAVLKAADDLLVAHGYQQLTIEKIAHSAGVSKQTIYRWWKSKNDILFDACMGDLEQEIAFPDSGNVLNDLVLYLTGLAAFITESDAGAVLRTLIAQAEDDPMLRARLRDELLPRQVARDRAVLDRAVADGRLVLDHPVAMVAEALVSPIYFRTVVLRTPIGPDEIAAHVDLVIGKVVRHASSSREGPRDRRS